MIGILGNIKEYFWGSREHATEFLGIGELQE